MLLAMFHSLNATADDDPPPSSFFGGGQWGAGLALIRANDDIVNEAATQNGIVRITDSQAWSAKLMLERHSYAGDENGCVSESWPMPKACVGLFVGVGLGQQQVIDMVGGGIVIGAGKVANATDKTLRQHNFGIGIGRQFRVKSLGDGVTANAALPAGETEVRFKYRDAHVHFLYTFSLPQ